MDTEAYIASGKLELYVAGLLSEDENREVDLYASQYPEIKQEIEAIENAILTLSEAAAGDNAENNFRVLSTRLEKEDDKVRTLPRSSRNWVAYTGWAAALILAAGLWYTLQQNATLEQSLESTSTQVADLEEQISEARNSLAATETLLEVLRERDMKVVPLGGQDVSPDAYAKAFWNPDKGEVYIDAKGLPEPPPGMVYQVWSLKLAPLTPTSIGLLDEFTTDENRVFALASPGDTEAFGITLEPEGGSETPTLEQLYALGAVAS